MQFEMHKFKNNKKNSCMSKISHEISKQLSTNIISTEQQ